MCRFSHVRLARHCLWRQYNVRCLRYLTTSSSKQQDNHSQQQQHHYTDHIESSVRAPPTFPSLSNILAYSAALIVVGCGFVYKQLQQLDESLNDMIPDVMKRDKHSFLFSTEKVPELVKEKEENLHKETKFAFTKRKDWFAWLKFHGHNIFAIIQLTKSQNVKARHFAIEALATIRTWPWTDAEYRMLAQALDPQAVIALAHFGKTDRRFFLPPPPLPPTSITVEQELKQLVESLPTKGLERCAEYYVETALHKKHSKKHHKDGEHEELMWSMDGSGREFLVASSPTEQTNAQIYMRFLQALLGHSKLKSHCVNMVKNKGMLVLRRVYEAEKDHEQILCILGKILANLSYHDDLHDDLYKAGWVSVFAEWMREDNLALKLQASKALNNMDMETERMGKFQDGVYIYYPQQRTHNHLYADVVFVHGLLGGPVFTWRQIVDPGAPDKSRNGSPTNDEEELQHVADADDLESPPEKSSCWPQDWLAKDCPNVRILTIEYDTHLSDWAPKCPYGKEKRTLYARSMEFLEKLQVAGIGQRPIIWVGHSMGGLLIKKMLLLAQDNPAVQNMVEKTRGIVFYSVPHRGSSLAAISKQHKYLLYPSIEVTELAQNAPHLLDLHEGFKDLVFHNKIPLLSFGEGQPLTVLNIKQVVIVPPESSDPGIGTFHLMPSMNHLTICKPAAQHSALYQHTLEFILACLPHIAVPNVLKVDVLDENILPEETNAT